MSEKSSDSVPETGKCKIARRKLEAFWGQFGEIRGQLETTQKALKELLKELPDITIITIGDDKDAAKINNPPRLSFRQGEITFFIDFRVASNGDDIEGNIVYGALREPCYPHSLLLTCKSKMEEKPLLVFSVNDHGIASAKGKLTGEWCLFSTENNDKLTEKEEEVMKELREMHYRALDCICRDALNWTNEPFLP